ncbi:hypothetical protein TDB9533_00466 [Thalassocella blandensis]|nr:hypothetical protein TDB9533_00466 [Thalassocella blandensis]
MLKKLLTSERHPSKVEAVFNSATDAQQARQQLTDFTFLRPDEIMIIEKNDRHWSKKVEPEVRGIQNTLLKTHFIFGAGGLFLGWIFGWGLTVGGIPLAASNPILATSMTAFFGLMIGLMFAGLATLRPDHDPIVASTRAALESGKTVLIVHAESHRGLENAERELKKISSEVHSTF